MYCYIYDGTYFRQSTPIHDSRWQEISEEEYTKAVEALMEAAKKECEEAAEIEKSKDDRIAELEQENAALLFEVLTGEAYADV